MQPNRRRHAPTGPGAAFAPVTPRHLAHRRRGPEAARPALRRYRRAYDGAGDPALHGQQRLAPHGPVRRRRRGVMEGFRRTPLRDGLVGLAMVGAATPLAMSRLSALRTDPSHEDAMPSITAFRPVSDQAVSQRWRAEADRVEEEKVSTRDTLIDGKLERYQDLGLDRELAESIYDIALESDIDPDIAFGLVRTESEFKPTARSRVGAVGLTQLMPATARWLRPGTTTDDLRQPEINMRIGFKYLRELIDKYDGNQELALLAYNRGPGTVDRVLARGGDPNNGYVEAVVTGEGVHR